MEKRIDKKENIKKKMTITISEELYYTLSMTVVKFSDGYGIWNKSNVISAVLRNTDPTDKVKMEEMHKDNRNDKEKNEYKKIPLILPADLYNKIADSAKSEGISKSEFIERTLRDDKVIAYEINMLREERDLPNGAYVMKSTNRDTIHTDESEIKPNDEFLKKKLEEAEEAFKKEREEREKHLDEYGKFIYQKILRNDALRVLENEKVNNLIEKNKWLRK